MFQFWCERRLIFSGPRQAGSMSMAHWAAAVTAKRFSPRAVLMAKCWGWIETMKRLPRRATAYSVFGARSILRQTSFSELREVLAEIGWVGADGIILDLGVSSWQIDAPQRGFSFRLGGRLDMRMDRRQSLDAYRLVNTATVEELMRIFRDYGEEPQARRIAERIAAERKQRSIESTDDLARLVEGVKGGRRRDHHPATQVFQALRIAVNQELDQLEHFLADGFELLRPGARLVIISFHSLEDRLVKNAFRKWSRACLCPPRALVCQCGWSQKVKVLTKRPVVPGEAETAANPRARSAKLRAAERV